MDGFTPLVLDNEQVLTAAPAAMPEKGDWVAVRAGDSALIVWFPAGD